MNAAARAASCGFFVVLRTPDDLVVLERPPWWTPRRLGIALGLVLAALVAVLLWNKSLRTLAERRGRELFRRQIEKASADLKVEERTRLAVELHDSLAQTLTGVAMEIETAGQFAEGAGADLIRHLDTAAKALDSSRAELRNCLWDLRSAALEEPDNRLNAVPLPVPLAVVRLLSHRGRGAYGSCARRSLR